MKVLFVEFYNTGKSGRVGTGFFPFSSESELQSIKSYIINQHDYGDYENFTVFDYKEASNIFLKGSIKDVIE